MKLLSSNQKIFEIALDEAAAAAASTPAGPPPTIATANLMTLYAMYHQPGQTSLISFVASKPPDHPFEEDPKFKLLVELEHYV